MSSTVRVLIRATSMEYVVNACIIIGREASCLPVSSQPKKKRRTIDLLIFSFKGDLDNCSLQKMKAVTPPFFME